jgi:hypothetical protein
VGRSKKKGRGYVSGGEKKKKREGIYNENRGRVGEKCERNVFWEL